MRGSSTRRPDAREEGKPPRHDKWQTCALAPGTCSAPSRSGAWTSRLDDLATGSAACWMRHPCIASLQLARVQYDPAAAAAAFDGRHGAAADRVRATLERVASHALSAGRSPRVMLRSFMYASRGARVLPCARHRARPLSAPYRVLAKVLDAEKEQYLLKLADFGLAAGGERCPKQGAAARRRPARNPGVARAQARTGRRTQRRSACAPSLCGGSRDPTVYMMIRITSRTATPLWLSAVVSDDRARSSARSAPSAVRGRRPPLRRSPTRYFDGLSGTTAQSAGRPRA